MTNISGKQIAAFKRAWDKTYTTYEAQIEAALEAADAAAWKKIEDATDEDKKINVQVYGPRASGGYYIETCKYFEMAGKWPVIFMQDYGEPTHFRHLPEPPK